MNDTALELAQIKLLIMVYDEAKYDNDCLVWHVVEWEWSKGSPKESFTRKNFGEALLNFGAKFVLDGEETPYGKKWDACRIGFLSNEALGSKLRLTP